MTPRQKQLLIYIINYQRRNTGLSPTFQDMAEYMGQSKSRIHALMQALKAHGYLHYETGKKRQIHVMYGPKETPSPDFRYRGRSTIKLAEYLSARFGIEESEVRQALLEMPA